jgi:hypothetical protein
MNPKMPKKMVVGLFTPAAVNAAVNVIETSADINTESMCCVLFV